MTKREKNMTNQPLIDFENAEIEKYNNLIIEQNQKIVGLDGAIAQQQANIDYFNTQKTQAEADIATYNVNIDDLNAIIVILEAS